MRKRRRLWKSRHPTPTTSPTTTHSINTVAESENLVTVDVDYPFVYMVECHNDDASNEQPNPENEANNLAFFIDRKGRAEELQDIKLEIKLEASGGGNDDDEDDNEVKEEVKVKEEVEEEVKINASTISVRTATMSDVRRELEDHLKLVNQSEDSIHRCTNIFIKCYATAHQHAVCVWFDVMMADSVPAGHLPLIYVCSDVLLSSVKILKLGMNYLEPFARYMAKALGHAVRVAIRRGDERVALEIRCVVKLWCDPYRIYSKKYIVKLPSKIDSLSQQTPAPPIPQPTTEGYYRSNTHQRPRAVAEPRKVRVLVDCVMPPTKKKITYLLTSAHWTPACR